MDADTFTFIYLRRVEKHVLLVAADYHLDMTLLTLALTIAVAGAADTCRTTLSCELKDHRFKLEFRSPSGDCLQDDGELLLDGKSLGLTRGWIDQLRAFGNAPSLCASPDLPAPSVYAIGAGRVLVLYWRSGRPQYDWMGAALLDLKSGRLVHEIERLGELKERVILKSKTGFRTRLVREHLSQVACDCSAAAIEDWLTIEVVGNKIKTRWAH